VGREMELNRLTPALSDAALGLGHLVLVSGEPGIGKSRLAREFTARARAHGALVLWGRAWEEAEAAPFWPWTQVIRTLMAEGEASDLHDLPALLGIELSAVLAQSFPELRALLGGVRPPADVEPARARFLLR